MPRPPIITKQNPRGSQKPRDWASDSDVDDRAVMIAERAGFSRWGLTAILVAALVLCYLLREVLLPFAVAAAIAYIAWPVMRWSNRRLHIHHALAASIVFVALLVLLALGGFWIQATFIPESLHVAQRLPETIHHAIVQLFHGENVHFMGRDTTAQSLTDHLTGDASRLLANPQSALRAVLFSFEAIIGLTLTLVLLFFFLLDGPRILRGILWLAPPDWRCVIRETAIEAHPILLRYLRGLIVIVLYAAAVTWIGVGLIFHWPHAVLLSILTGILELLPVIGPIASATILGLVAVEQGSVWIALGFALFALILRLSIDQVVGPLVLGRAVKLHPVVIIFAFLAGGVLFGALGVFLAIPVAAVAKIAIRNHYEREGFPASPSDLEA